MLAEIRYGLQLKWLQHKKRKTNAFYAKEMEKLRKKKASFDDRQALHGELSMELDWLNDEIAQKHNSLLVEQAENRLIPVPPFSTTGTDWVQSDTSDRWRLSSEAAIKLRTAIRADRKETGEYWRGWLTALTGVTGAMIGLVTALSKCGGPG